MSWWSRTWHSVTGRTQRKAAEAQARALNQQARLLREQGVRTTIERGRAESRGGILPQGDKSPPGELAP